MSRPEASADTTTSRAAAVNRALALAGIPARYLSAAPRDDLLGGAYITGNAGVGKTYAACGAVRAFVERHVTEVEGEHVYRGPKAKFVSAPAWFAALRSTYSSKGESEQQVFDLYAKCGLLVLDDLGKGSRSEWAVERIYMLMDERYSNARPTIITSNYDLAEVASKLSTDQQTQEAIASRIMGMCRGIRMVGDDRRVS